MKPEFNYTPFQRAWIDAIRSGKYKQGKGRLKQIINLVDIRYCCLGVACEIYNKFARENNWTILKQVDNIDPDCCISVNIVRFREISLDEESNTATLTSAVRDALHLRSKIGCFTYPIGSPSSLANLNDSFGYTFEQIADFIESNPELIFTNK